MQATYMVSDICQLHEEILVLLFCFFLDPKPKIHTEGIANDDFR